MAVDDVSFEIKEGESFGLVGESGSGKSTIAKMIVNLFKPSSGDIFFDNVCITKIKNKLEMMNFPKTNTNDFSRSILFLEWKIKS
jgi:peptide/nickel transport system ATP-binding protein